MSFFDTKPVFCTQNPVRKIFNPKLEPDLLNASQKHVRRSKITVQVRRWCTYVVIFVKKPPTDITSQDTKNTSSSERKDVVNISNLKKELLLQLFTYNWKVFAYSRFSCPLQFLKNFSVLFSVILMSTNIMRGMRLSANSRERDCNARI